MLSPTFPRLALRGMLMLTLAILALGAATGPAAAAASAAEPHNAAADAPLHAMTFNLRYETHADTGTHAWSERRRVVRTLLCNSAPDLIGTQEGLDGQLRDLDHDLGPGYARVGEGREGGTRGEYAALYYNTHRLKDLEHGQYWLSTTPSVTGSRSWGAHLPRIATWARFLDRATGKQFYAVNTHLDSDSQYARERSADLIAARLQQLDPALPRIVTGDFNSPARHNPAHETLLNAGHLQDTWDTADTHGREYATYNGYRPPHPGGDRIDWILASPNVHTCRTWMNPYTDHGRLPSDHLPVEASLRF